MCCLEKGFSNVNNNYANNGKCILQVIKYSDSNNHFSMSGFLQLSFSLSLSLKAEERAQDLALAGQALSTTELNPQPLLLLSNQFICG